MLHSERSRRKVDLKLAGRSVRSIERTCKITPFPSQDYLSFVSQECPGVPSAVVKNGYSLSGKGVIALSHPHMLKPSASGQKFLPSSQR